MRSLLTSCCKPSEVTGRTLKPSSSMRNGIFVGAVGGAAVLHDAHAAGGNLVGDAMVEQDDAIGDVFFQSVAGQGAVAALAGDDGGDALVFQPAEEAAQLGAENAFILQSRRTALRWCRARRAWRRWSRSRRSGG